MINGGTTSSLFRLFETAPEDDEVPQAVHHHNGCSFAPMPKDLKAACTLQRVVKQIAPMAIRIRPDERGLAAMNRKGAR